MTENLARDLPHMISRSGHSSIRCKRLFGNPLSTPSAAEGGGRRPAFTEGCRTAILDHQKQRLVPIAAAPIEPGAAPSDNEVGTETDSSPFTRGFLPPPTRAAR